MELAIVVLSLSLLSLSTFSLTNSTTTPTPLVNTNYLTFHHHRHIRSPMENEGKQRTSRDRMMKMQIGAAAAAAAAEKYDDVKKMAAVVGGGGGGGSGGGTGSSGSKRLSSGGSSESAAARSCQAENCAADLTVASKQYHRRHRVCEYHAKAAAVVVAGVRQRFCQQCSRFHELLEFDDTKRSCRRRLAGHNERRRKNSSGESNSDSLNGKVSQLSYGEVDDGGKIRLAIPHDNANCKKLTSDKS